MLRGLKLRDRRDFFFFGQYPNISQQTIVLGALTEKRNINEAFQQHISRLEIKLYNRKLKRCPLKVPNPKHSQKKMKINITISEAATPKPAAQVKR